ncbi:L,D-transpeptidase [Microbacterium sp. NPDC091313]
MSTPPVRAPRRRTVVALAVAAAVVLVVGAVVWALTTRSASDAAAPAPAASASASATPAATSTPTATPTPTGPAADTTAYALDGLPTIDVYSVIPALPVDDDPTGAFTGQLATARSDAIPVFAAPGSPPVAAFPRDNHYGGTTVPVIQREDNWVRVLLSGREAVPSTGDPGQLTGWLRVQDVDLTAVTASVQVDIGARTIDIVHADGSTERVASDFAWGTDATPTPRGRTFVMLTRAEASFTYTRGHPLVYLGVQSPTLDGFGGATVAVTAFHYHDTRSGPISNGCLRLDAAAIDRLAQLPAGTPVSIR